MTSLREETASLEDIPTHEFGHFLHALRTRRLKMMPAGAAVVLSGGAAGSVYFEWFGGNYPTHVERHIAVEYFTPPPDPLPDGVEWLARTLGDLAPVGDGEVDLVFAGQVIEHLWPDDMAGFLREANRVLRPDGYVVIDSPTRLITDALAWAHPEHTIELEVDEIIELLELAGFVEIDITGIWLCYDRDRDQMLPLDIFGGGAEWPWRRRVIEAESRPHDSFIWWAEARNGERRGDVGAVRRRVQEIYDRVRPTYYNTRVRTEVGEPADDHFGRRFRAPLRRPGLLLRGPSIAMPPGRHEAVFRLRAEPTKSRPARDQRIAEVEVTRDGGQVVAEWSLDADALPPGGAPREVTLPFELPDTAFDSEVRVRSLGIVPLLADVPVAVRERVPTGGSPRVRPLARDAVRVYAQDALRRAKRVVGWPARRLLDPRLEGLRNHEQWLAATIGERIDARAGELGARIDGVAARVQPAVLKSTPRERSEVVPYVLKAVGRLQPGTAILVIGAAPGPVSAVLESLGYQVVAATSPAAAPPVAAAVVGTPSFDQSDVEQVLRRVQPEGIVVLITETVPHARIEELFNGWQIEDQTTAPSQGDSGPRLIMVRASRLRTAG